MMLFAGLTALGLLVGVIWLQLLGLLICSTWMILDGVITLELDNRPWMMRVAAGFTGMIPVVIMDFNHKERLTLVSLQQDDCYLGPLSVAHDRGTIRLLPNGLVDRHHGNSHCYIWKPLDRALEVELMLRSASWPSWDEWRRLSHSEMMLRRKSGTEV